MLNIRGQEAKLTLTIEGIEFKMQVNSFTLKPREELVEQDFIGEANSKIDALHSGYDFSWEAPVADAAVVRYMKLRQDRNLQGLPPPKGTIAVELVFRERGQRPTSFVLIDAQTMVSELSAGGRKDYAKQSFEGKAPELLII